MTGSEARRQQWREAQQRRRAGEPKRRVDVAVCGSPAGYNRHRRAGEQACAACRQAVAEYRKQRRN